MRSSVALLCLACVLPGHAADTLGSLIGFLGATTDVQVQRDVLRGLRDATQGRQRVPMPSGWEAIEARLAASADAEVRALSRALGLTFGSQAALEAMRAAVRDRALDAGQRQDALRALVAIRDASLPPTLRELLGEPALRGAAVRAIAVFDDPANAPALLAAYPTLSGTERRDALNTLAARPVSARLLLEAIREGRLSNRDLTAEVIRQLRSLRDDAVNASLTAVYGSVREVAADKQAEIERYRRIYRAGGSTPGDAIRGRTVYARICQQCHVLFDVGGSVGPDLTGSNRGDLEYILQNILDPNAVLPNEYLASTLEMKDGRVLTGILKRQDDRSYTVATATETVTVPRAEVAEISQSQLSMMPEGLLAPLSDQEFRDLIYYLGRPGQAPMLGTPDTINLFFSGRDLSLWQGDPEVWRVEGGELVGEVPAGRREAAVLRSEMILEDFRLRFEAQVAPARADAGVAFRAEPAGDAGVRGYRLHLSGEWAGKISEEGGRGRLGEGSTAAGLNPSGWNAYEIVAVGSRIRTSVNGRVVTDRDDPAGARRGIIALQLGPDGARGLRLRHLDLELHGAAGAGGR